MDIYTRMKNLFVSFRVLILTTLSCFADGVVSQVVSAPIFANGTVRDIPSGINIYLQNDNVRGLNFMNPDVIGYGVPPGGSLEVEMLSGFERDPKVPLDGRSLLLAVGAPQQGLPERASGHIISQGDNEFTYVIKPTSVDGMNPAGLASSAKGVAFDQVQQRGIKIIHMGGIFHLFHVAKRALLKFDLKIKLVT